MPSTNGDLVAEGDLALGLAGGVRPQRQMTPVGSWPPLLDQDSNVSRRGWIAPDRRASSMVQPSRRTNLRGSGHESCRDTEPLSHADAAQ